MPEKLIPMHGTSSAADEYTGSKSEITMDETNNTIRVHDGVKAGGHALARLDQVGEGSLTISPIHNYTFLRENGYLLFGSGASVVDGLTADFSNTNMGTIQSVGKVSGKFYLELKVISHDFTSDEERIDIGFFGDPTSFYFGVRIFPSLNGAALGFIDGAVESQLQTFELDASDEFILFADTTKFNEVTFGVISGSNIYSETITYNHTIDTAFLTGINQNGTNNGSSRVYCNTGNADFVNKAESGYMPLGSGLLSNIYDLAVKEDSLGSPDVTGKILSSTSEGVRTWIDLPESEQKQELPNTTFYAREDDVVGNIFKFRPTNFNSPIAYINDIPTIPTGFDPFGVDIEISEGTTTSPVGTFGLKVVDNWTGNPIITLEFDVTNFSAAVKDIDGNQIGTTIPLVADSPFSLDVAQNADNTFTARMVINNSFNSRTTPVFVGEVTSVSLETLTLTADTDCNVRLACFTKDRSPLSQGIAIGDLMSNNYPMLRDSEVTGSESNKAPKTFTPKKVVDIVKANSEASIPNPASNGQVLSSTTSGARSWVDLPALVKSDWNETSTSADSFIQNKPTIPDISGKEDALGNPTTDGQILSSTAAGVRSWIEPSSGGGIKAGYSRLFMDCLNDPSAPLVKPDGTIITLGGIGGKLMGRSKYKIPNSFYFEITKVSSSSSSLLSLLFCPITTTASGDTTDFSKGFGVRFLQTASENTVSLGEAAGTSLTDIGRVVTVDNVAQTFACDVGDTVGFSVSPNGFDMTIIAKNITQGTSITYTHNDGATNWSGVTLDLSVLMSGIVNGSYHLNTGQKDFLGNPESFPVLDHVSLGVNRSLVILWSGSKQNPTLIDDYKVRGTGNWFISTGTATPDQLTISNMQERHAVETSSGNFIANTLALKTLTAQPDLASMTYIQTDVNLVSNSVGIQSVNITRVAYTPL